MGLFDFLKKKPKDEPLAEDSKESLFDLDGIEVETPEKEGEEILLEVEESSDETTAVNRAIGRAMGAEAVQIFRANEDSLYQETGADASEEDELEITLENGETFVPENEEGGGEFVAQLGDFVEEMLQKPSGEEELLVTTADGGCYTEEASHEGDAFLEEVMTLVEESLQEELEEEKVAENNNVTEDEVNEEVAAQAPEEQKMGFFAKLMAGLDKTRKNILGGVDAVLGGFTKIDEDLFEELEEALIMADMGVQTTMYIVENLRKRVKREHATDPSLIKGMLADEITAILSEGVQDEENLPNPSVILVIGVNGVGKTTTIGKLASRYKAEGHSVLLAAADTFRAAAIDQLEVWGQRSGIEVVKHEENSDPAAVVYDAVHAARSQKADLLICDTAGRLHNKKNLMEELRKIGKVIEREHPEAHNEVYLVLDATTGQNALQQAKLFQEVAQITGIILTKLDGTAKGGIVVAIKSELQIPVRYIGVGEGIQDLQRFDAREFAKALFGA